MLVKLKNGFLEIPREMLLDLGWMLHDELSIKRLASGLVIEKRKNIKELFDGYKRDYAPCEIDWGEAKGREIFE